MEKSGQELPSSSAVCMTFPSKIKHLESEFKTLQNEVNKLKRRNNLIVSNNKRKLILISQIKREIKDIDKEKENPKEDILRSLFSEAQINVLKGCPKKVYWTDDDLAQAFSLRHMGGKDFYLYMKNTLNYPLPSLSCVQAWAANK